MSDKNSTASQSANQLTEVAGAQAAHLASQAVPFGSTAEGSAFIETTANDLLENGLPLSGHAFGGSLQAQASAVVFR
jgi:hypothetical protein